MCQDASGNAQHAVQGSGIQNNYYGVGPGQYAWGIRATAA
jgi:hypothetical protein